MSTHQSIDRICAAAVILSLLLTLVFMNGSALGLQASASASAIGYENRLFDNTRVHTMDIVMDNWDELIANATSEIYYAASVVIDGESYKNVGIRGKGNTSLSTVAALGSQRYSFKIEFDHYDSTKSYHGLDKLSLNNLIQDSTMMKDYLTYTMMNEFGAASPLCSFVYITVNGEDWGLYLAVEGVEDSFLERNYGADAGELYKPDSTSFGGGRGNGKDFDMSAFEFDAGEARPGNFDPSSKSGGMPSFGNGEVPEDFDPSAMSSGKGDLGGMGSSDVKLQYLDDDPDSYSNIWNNAKTDITNADRERLIESLEKLSKGEEIESVVDVEQVIRYFVVHNFVCNGDSYTGSMIHNYYLYEKDGQLAMIPWDYNLAFGTFRAGSGQSAVNTPIDAPVSGGSGDDRPMWSWILSDEAYTELYHQYFAEFLSSVEIRGIIDNAYALIKPYVEKDPTAFYTYEEFETGVEALRQFCALRSESISMQLETGETTEDIGYADASSLNLSDMGAMNGGGMGGFGGDRPNRGDMPEGFDPAQLPGGFGGDAPDFSGQPVDGQTQATPPASSGGAEHAETARPAGWIWIAVSVLVLCAGLIAAKIGRH